MNSCENCANFIYDDENECYCCDANLDEDEMRNFLIGHTNSCPYFYFYDEYGIVRKQN
jgi:hypothetical protein